MVKCISPSSIDALRGKKPPLPPPDAKGKTVELPSTLLEEETVLRLEEPGEYKRVGIKYKDFMLSLIISSI
jgi:hypothetical protein